MSSVVLPSPRPFSGSSLVTFVIRTPPTPRPVSQLSLTPATRSETLTVWYVWFGGHSVTEPPVVISGACVSLTVTLKLQDGPTELVQVTVVSPTSKKEPEGWSHVTVPQPSPEGSS